MSYSSVVSGKLKLKSNKPTTNTQNDKKRKRDPTEDSNAALLAATSSKPPSNPASSSASPPPPTSTKGDPTESSPQLRDNRTEAQKAYDRALAKREADRVKKLASKSHRQKVEEFNQHLSTLSEHHDIPKVGPG